MDITSGSSSNRDAARRSSNVSHPPTGASKVTLPMNGSTSFQGITAATVPFVQSSLADLSLQPSALVFRSGIAFDYDNFPRILSVCWPVFNIESGMPLIARDGPERSLTQLPTNETITVNNDARLSGAPGFTWGTPHSEPIVKDPVISTQEKKAPVGLTIRDSCEIKTETITSNTNEWQEEATTIPHVRQKQGSCYEATESTTSKKAEISGEEHSQEGAFDNVHLRASEDSEEVTICKDLGQKRASTKPVQVTMCDLCLLADNKQGALQAKCSLGPANHEREKFDQPWCSIKPQKRPNDCKPTAEVLSLDVSSNLRSAEDASIVKEDIAVPAANKTDRSEESYVFCSSPPRQSDSGNNHSRVNVKQGKEDKRENVRDLITRIKYIKSRLDRAESDYRKKRMLKAIIILQKRVKAIVKGRNKEKVDPGKRQQETSSSNEGHPGQEFAENTELGSQGDVSLLLDVKQASKDSSKGNTGRGNQQSCKELTVVSPPVIVVNRDDDVTRSETRTADELKSTTFRHSKDWDINYKNNNNKRRENRGSLSLITSNGSVDELSLRLPFGIGLDCSPCGKRAVSSSELDENDLQKDQSFKAKKMKKLSLSEEDVKKIDPRFEDVTHHIQSVTKDGALKEERRDENTNNVESDASRNDECDLLIRKEFSLSDTNIVTVFNSTDAAQGISAVDNWGVPLNSIGDVQAEENNRKANKGIEKDRSAVWNEINGINDAATTVNCSGNKSNANVEMNEIHGHNSCSEEMQDVTINFTPVEDKNSSGQEEKQRPSLLERVLQEEETQGYTSPAIHNPSGRQEDFDLTQSLQIREARILNLTRKRDRLLNLTGFK